MVISAYSNRIYKSKLTKEELRNINSMLIDCNNVKIKIYSDIVNGKLNINDLNTTYIIDNFYINTYYANMIIKKVKEGLKSNQKLQDIYIADNETKILEIEEKVQKSKQKLEILRKLKLECIKYTKTKKENKILKAKFIFPYNFIVNDKNITIKTSKQEWDLYNFEIYINHRIKKMIHYLYNLKNKLNRQKQKLENLKNKTYISCFGSKYLFKKQFTVEEYIRNHDKWLKEWKYKRYNNFVISGSKKHIGGSMCARYDFLTNKLKFMSYRLGIKSRVDSKQYTSIWYEIPCRFLYNKKEYEKAYNNQSTIAYQIVDRGDYYIIQAIFEIDNNKDLNYYTGNGVIGIDINVDCFALSNINKNVNLIDSKVIKFNLNDKTSNQITKTIEDAVCKVFTYCNERNKPLVREDINNIIFKNTGNKKKNKVFTQFAYDKIISVIDRKFYKNNIEVYKVNPVYTSQQGKILYMAKLGLSIHESASYCIARRYLFSTREEKVNAKGVKYIATTNLFYEDLGRYKKFGNIKKISTIFKKLKVRDFYRLHKIPVKLENYTKLDKYINDVKDYLNREEILKVA